MKMRHRALKWERKFYPGRFPVQEEFKRMKEKYGYARWNKAWRAARAKTPLGLARGRLMVMMDLIMRTLPAEICDRIFSFMSETELLAFLELVNVVRFRAKSYVEYVRASSGMDRRWWHKFVGVDIDDSNRLYSQTKSVLAERLGKYGFKESTQLAPLHAADETRWMSFYPSYYHVLRGEYNGEDIRESKIRMTMLLLWHGFDVFYDTGAAYPPGSKLEVPGQFRKYVLQEHLQRVDSPVIPQ